MYDSIIKILCTKLQHESELKDKEKFLLFHDMTDNWIIKGTNSSYEVLVSWQDGYFTWENLLLMQRDDPIYLDNYVYDHDLLDYPGQKQLLWQVKNNKKMNRLLKDAKSKQLRNTARINFSMDITCYCKE